VSVLAVNHHYYREVSPPAGIYPINRARLAAEVETLRRNYRPIAQRDLLDILAHPEIAQHDDVFLLTFDDGLKEQMAALRDLESLGVAALFFVPTAPLIERRVLDVHKLHLIRATRSDEVLLVDLKELFPVAWDRLDDAAAIKQYRYDDAQARRVKYLLNFALTPQERREWLDRLFSTVVGTEAEVAKALYMDRDDIRLLGRTGMLGTHAHAHLPLAQLGCEDMRRDIAQSLDVLNDLSNDPVSGISFPYGGPDAVSESVVQACAELGLSYGFTMQRGRNEVEEMGARYRLKRIDCNDVVSFA
jgi:peptidoglycan/xylan/chitin deacetylase (PgdA/CDA1 family)